MNTYHYSKLRFQLSLVVIMYLLASCTSETPKKVNRQGKELKITLSDTLSRRGSEVLKSIEYIPLETTNESLFSEITRLEITDDYFIIHDKTANAIFFFLKDGKFSHKITNKDKSFEQSFKDIGHISIDRTNKNLLIRDKGRLKTVTYSLNGKKIEERDWPFNYSELNEQDGQYIYYRGFDFGDSEPNLEAKGIKFNNLLIGSLDGDIKNSYLPYDTTKFNYTEIYKSHQSIYDSGDSVTLLSNSYNYQINKFNGSQMKPVYHIAFEEDNVTLPDDFLSNQKYHTKRKAFTDKNKNVVWNCSDVYIQQNRFITFNPQRINKPNSPFLYDLKKNKSMNLENIISEEKINYGLPVYGLTVNGSDGEYFYSAITSDFMFRARELLGESKLLPKSIKDYMDQKTRLLNPVISKFKLNTL